MTNEQIVAYLHLPAQFDKPAMTFPVRVGTNLVGKTKGDIQIAHDFISGLHANIEIFDSVDNDENGDCDHWIEDLDSTNGTYFGDSTVSLRPKRFYQLSHGRQLRLGRVLAFYNLADPVNDSQESLDRWNTTAEKTALLPRLHEAFSPVDDDAEKSQTDLNQMENENNAGNSAALPSLDHIMNMARKVATENSQESVVANGERDMSLVPSENEIEAAKPESSYSSLPQDTTTIADDDMYPTNLKLSIDKSQIAEVDAVEDFPLSAVNENQSIETNEEMLSMSPCFPSKKTLHLMQHSSPIKEIANSPQLLSEHRHELLEKNVDENHSTIEGPAVEKPSKKGAKKPTKKKTAKKKKETISTAATIPEIVDKASSRRSSKTESLIDDIDIGNEQEISSLVEEEKPSSKGQRKRTLKENEPPSSRPTKQSKTSSQESNSNDESIRVAFTGVEDVDKKTKILSSCGAHVVDSWSDCTHLVADKIKRTTKFLCALSSGKHILSSKWIDACKKNNDIANEASYCLKDAVNEKKWKFKLQQSIDRVRERGPKSLFKSLKFLITPSVTPDYLEMKEIIESGGGSVLSDLPVKHSDDVFIIGCKEDKELIQHYNQSGWKEQVMTNEFILTCSLTQNLEMNAFRMTKSRR